MNPRHRLAYFLGSAQLLTAGVVSAQIAPTTQNQGTPTAAPTGDVAPRLLQFVQADYPAEALAQGIEGSVLLQLSVDAGGQVTEVRLINGLGHGLDESAVAAARRFVFEPGRRAGQPVPAVLRYRYRFSAQAARQAQVPVVRTVLRGSVRASGDRPLANAAVAVTLPDGTRREASTDAEGVFRFELEVEGDLRVVVRAEAYSDFEVTETLRNRDEIGVTYRPTPVAATATDPARPPTPEEDSSGEAVVRARRPAREVTRQTLEFREILRMPGTGGDALRAVQNFPGVGRSINGLLIVRGSTPQDTQIFADGTLIPIIYHFGGLSSVINSEFLDHIDFYPGNYSGRFGRAQGGVVDVGLRSPRREGWRVVGNINLIDASLFVEGAITPKLSVAASIRRSYVDAILGAVLSNITAVTITSLPVYWDYQLMLEWRPGARDRVRVSMLGSDDTFAIILNRPNEMAPRFSGTFSSGIGFHTGQVLWEHTFSPALSSRAVLSLGRNAINFGGGEAFGLDLNFWQYTARYEVQYQASSRLRANFGFDILGGPANITFNGIRPPTEGQQVNAATVVRVATSATDIVYRPAAYAELEMTPVRGLRLIPSLRVDYSRDANRTINVAPRLAFRWDFLDTWTLKGGIGVFNQPPQNNQTSAAPNSFFPNTTIGNPGLITQRSVHYGLGMEHTFSRYVTLSVEGFYKHLDEQVVSQSGIGSAAYLNNGGGRIYGGELLLRHRPSERFFGWLAYTISRSERQDSPGADYRIFQFDQTHILTAIASFKLGRGWEMGARFRLVSGNPNTPVAGSVFNGDTGTYTQVPGVPFSARNNPFHQLDVRIDKTWTFRRGSINLFLEVLNAYNNSNPEGVQYNYNFTQSQTVTGIPIFPNLGVRVEY